MNRLNIRGFAERYSPATWDETAMYEMGVNDLRAICADWLRLTEPLGGKFAEIEAREKAATKGPWEQFSYQHGSIDNGQNPQRWVPFTADDELFTEHARTDIPELLQEIRRLTAERGIITEPGKASGIVAGIFDIARQRCGRVGFEGHPPIVDILRALDEKDRLTAAHEADRLEIERLKADLEIANEGVQFYNRKAADAIVLRESDRTTFEAARELQAKTAGTVGAVERGDSKDTGRK